MFPTVAPLGVVALLVILGVWFTSCSRPEVPTRPIAWVELLSSACIVGKDPETTTVYCHARNRSSAPALLYVFIATGPETWSKGSESIRFAPGEERAVEATVPIQKREIVGLLFSEEPRGEWPLKDQYLKGEVAMRVMPGQVPSGAGGDPTTSPGP